MAEKIDEKGFFEKLSEILSAPLPGTEEAPQPLPKGADAVGRDVGDDDSLFDRIRDVLASPVEAAEAADARDAHDKPVASGDVSADAPSRPASTTTTADDELPEWYRFELARFEEYQAAERRKLSERQRQEMAAFQRYQQTQMRNFGNHQLTELNAFHRHQSARLEAWKQMGAGGRPAGVVVPPGWPAGMPPPPGWRPGMPLPPAPPQGWMPPGPWRGRR